MKFTIQFYTMFTAPKVLLIALLGEDAAAGKKPEEEKYDFVVDMQVNIKAFCKSVAFCDCRPPAPTC